MQTWCSMTAFCYAVLAVSLRSVGYTRCKMRAIEGVGGSAFSSFGESDVNVVLNGGNRGCECFCCECFCLILGVAGKGGAK